VDLVKLWLHEASRVYGDKLIETKDMDTFQKMKLDIAKAGFEVSLYIIDRGILNMGAICVDETNYCVVASFPGPFPASAVGLVGFTCSWFW
jgi:hypothetical protein